MCLFIDFQNAASKQTNVKKILEGKVQTMFLMILFSPDNTLCCLRAHILWVLDENLIEKNLHH